MVILPVIFAEFSEWKNCRCIFEKLYGHEEIKNSLTYTVRFFFRLHFAVGCNNRRRIFLKDFNGIQFSRVEDFPADHMHTCSGVHYKLSFLRLHCGWQTPLIGRWKECSFCPFLWAYWCFWQVSHASPQAHRSCLSVSSWDLSSNFIGQGLRWWGTLTCILFSDGPLFSRMFAWRSAALVNRTRQISPKTFVPFRKIIEDSGGSVSCNTQPNCRTSFAVATCTFVTTLLRFSLWLFLNLPVRKRAFTAEFTCRIQF